MQWGGKRAFREPIYGKRALVGQYTQDGKDRNGQPCRIDLAERKNFERSVFIPGNGPEHRLGMVRAPR